jgi:hypothetical protein
VAMNTWLEPELERELCEVAAPPELWSRVQSARLSRPRESHRGLVWATAATVILAAVALSRVPAGGSAAAGQSAAADNDSQPIGLHCQNPAQIRAWEVARATDVSAAASPSVVTGARFTLAGNNSAALQLSCKLCHLD